MEKPYPSKIKPIRSKIDDIQVLRGVAAIAVTLYHTKDVIKEGQPFEEELDFFFNAGPFGVSLFFVISGFIMVHVTQRIHANGRNIVQFLVKRFIRIWPVYALITLGFYFLRYRFNYDPNLVVNLVKSLLFIPLSTVEPPFYGYAILSVGWTLNYEMYFYALIAISLCFGKYRWFALFFMFVITLIVIPDILGDVTIEPRTSPDFGNAYLNMITNPIMWNFGHGVLIGLAYHHPFWSRLLTRIFATRLCAFAAISLAVWQYLAGFYGGFGPLHWGVGAVLLVLTFLFHNQPNAVTYPSWLVRLGDISFSMYLVHIPVIVAVSMIFARLNFHFYNTGPAMFFLCVSITIVLSNLSYEYLELRLSDYFKRMSSTVLKFSLVS